MKHVIALLALLFFTLALPGKVFSQKENNVWILGSLDKLDFNYSPARIIHNPDSLDVVTGHDFQVCTTYSDPRTGKLLFYGVLGVLFDSLNTYIDSVALPIAANIGSFEPLAVAAPGDSNAFYVFCAPSNPDRFSVHYEKIVRTDSGFRVANIVHLCGPGSLPALCAVRHANGRDLWIICGKQGNYAYRRPMELYAYLLTKDGLSDRPVVFEGLLPVMGFSDEGGGSLRASRDGTKLAFIQSLWPNFQIFDFDKKTGAITWKFIENDQYGAGVGTRSYLAFSPSGRFLYRTIDGGFSFVIQYDLSLSTPYEISDSAVVLASWTKHPDTQPGQGWASIQLGVDDKIYLAEETSEFNGLSRISRINYPDRKGLACGFEDSIGYVQGSTGLQNICETTPSTTSYHSSHLIYNVSSTCLPQCLELEARSDTTAESYEWTVYGSETESASGSTVTACYDSAGIFPVRIITKFAHSVDTTVQYVRVGQFEDVLSVPKAINKTVAVGTPVPIPLRIPLSWYYAGSPNYPYSNIEFSVKFDTSILRLPSDTLSCFQPPSGFGLVYARVHGNVIAFKVDSLLIRNLPNILSLGTLTLIPKIHSSSQGNVTLESLGLSSSDTEHDWCVNPESNLLAAIRTIDLGVERGVVESPKVYPNPATNSLTVSMPVAVTSFQYQILNILGETLRSGKSPSASLTLPIADIPAGSYYVRIESSVGIITKRFVVRR